MDSQAIRQVRRTKRIESFFIRSKTEAENCTQLKIRFALRGGRLCQSSDCYEPVVVSERDVRAYEDIPDFFFVAPARENKFVQEFKTD